MASKIAPTLTETGPKEEVAVSDVYTEKKSAPVNVKQPNRIAEAAKNVADSLKSTNNIADLAKAISVQDGKASIDKNSAKDLARAATGGTNSPLAELKSTIADELLVLAGVKDDRALQDAANGAGLPGQGTDKAKKGFLTLTNVKVLYSNYKAISEMDIKSATDVASLLNSISGNSQLAKVLDMESQFAILGKVVSKLSELGIPEAIDIILDKLEDDKERRRLMIENVRTFIYQSDLVSINKVIDYVGANGLLSRVPDAVNLIMTFYRYPYGQGRPTTTLRDQLKNTLDRIDANWYRYKRDNTWISNLEPFTYASQEALDLFELPIPADSPFTPVTNDFYVAVKIAKTYRSIDIIELARLNFPHAVLTKPRLYT